MPNKAVSGILKDLSLGVAAVLLFVPLFIFRGVGPLDFWWWMSLDLVLLIGLGSAIDRGFLPALKADLSSGWGNKLVFGAVSAAALYALFFAGNLVSRRILPFAGAGIADVYGFKAEASPIRIVLLMALLIGPGEELFWRGFLQRRWQDRFGRVPGFLAAAALYTFVHVGSGNPMLVLAAAVCGLFWGAIYDRTGSLLLVAVSHTLWDIAVFVLFPF
jgi:membrane protease YdiL (CAAX protease family)